MTPPLSQHNGYDEDDAYLCACKGEPYTAKEWEAEAVRLERALEDARERLKRANKYGVCLPRRFDD